MDAPDTCPYCDTSQIGSEIPEDKREMFGGTTHFRRTIFVIDPTYDRWFEARCPDCNAVLLRRM